MISCLGSKSHCRLHVGFKFLDVLIQLPQFIVHFINIVFLESKCLLPILTIHSSISWYLLCSGLLNILQRSFYPE